MSSGSPATAAFFRTRTADGDVAARLRATRMELLEQFAPILCCAAVATAAATALLLAGRVPVAAIAGWLLTIGGIAWLAVRRVQADALACLRRDVPRAVAIRCAVATLALAPAWLAMPVAVYVRHADAPRAALAAAMTATMAAALAVAAVPAVAIGWAATIGGGLLLAAFAGGDPHRVAIAAATACHMLFLTAVVRRTAGVARAQAERLARGEAESAAAQHLVREYEERGSSCLWQIDADNVLTYAAPGFAALVGRSVAQLIGTPLPLLIGGSRALGSALIARAPFAGVEVEIDDAGGRRALAFAGTPVAAADGVHAGFRGSCADVTETRSSERRLRQLASLDVLTELPNRMRMRELLGEALLAARGSGRPCGILMLDIDGFKPVNDTFGHPKGDAVLKTVAERLVATVGDRGIVGRLGGDEFAIVLHDAGNRTHVAELAERLIATVSERYYLDSVSVQIGLSVGSAFGPIDGDTVDDLIRQADLALYDAKASGRGAYRRFALTMQTEAENRVKLEHDLRQALSLDQFRVYYQPLIHSGTQEVTGFEALLRWQHPVRGFVPPSDFVPLAEEVGLIHELGEWVVRTAIRDCALWPTPITVAVNLSPLQLQSSHVPAMVSDALARHRLSPNRLELEVTESVFLGDQDGTLDVLRRLRGLGVRIALDDFGTGYSSLGYLNRTIFNKLKIDGSFVRGAGQRPETVSIIQAIVTLANCFQMTITAEGIETLEDYRRMADLGCHQMQGFLFGRPVPFARATELVGTRWDARRSA